MRRNSACERRRKRKSFERETDSASDDSDLDVGKAQEVCYEERGEFLAFM